MTQLYATGSAQPLTDGTITFLVNTPVEASMDFFLKGLMLGVVMSCFISGLFLFFMTVRKSQI
jgi:hypothetical protein